jgi:hypothetical protein
MKYVAVLSSQPGADVYTPIFNYFPDYLITLGEPTAGNANKIKTASWDIQTIAKHAKKIIYKENMGDGKNLYIDSGGFQIIKGHITRNMLSVYEQCFHDIIEKMYSDIYRIFSLDIFNFKMSPEDAHYYNMVSIRDSIDLIKMIPAVADKELFVIQSTNKNMFNLWKQLMVEQKVFDYFKLWSLGGLVGLKKDTNADFSHAVPATLWLLTYSKHYNGTINQMHWLGQSSRLAFLSMAMFEALYGIHMTADSSQLIRFAPIEQKMPFMSFDDDIQDFVLAQDHISIEKMFAKHSLGPAHSKKALQSFKNYAINSTTFVVADHDGSEEELSESDYDDAISNFSKKSRGRFSIPNEDIIELQSQNIFYEMQFAEKIVTELLKQPLEHWNADNLKEVHPILNRGRIAKEFNNNLNYFRIFAPIIEAGDTKAADEVMYSVLEKFSR